MPRNNFNSIKVQLELSAALEQLNVEPFQFHKGTIRTQMLPFLILMISYFNSIKVQLELPIILILSKFKIFQFHKGTIRTSGC